MAAQEEAAKAGGSRGASHATKGGEGRSRERPPPAGGHVQNMLGAVAALGQVITAQFALTLTLFSFKVPSSITAPRRHDECFCAEVGASLVTQVLVPPFGFRQTASS